ncbi:DUF397 domain-containing protein [Streptomyces sp. SID3343]|uniref:DUF397 domain-containing protein n=1 Tax=Streptomyces sp. SID3343 TaxID=2690260 RepID=UPI00136B4E49|nr:DUF397 domain-containing protein [Streptomyces sp. SID3343]MYW03192.1 DUF397 domain-containing protein [Streptomyces sp. SID3343]
MNLATGFNAPLAWRKSTFSGTSDDCVEAAPIAAAVAVRDSKDLTIGNFAVPNASWARLTEALKG